MSLQAILEAILASGDEQVREIETKASQQAHEILANAGADAEQIKEESIAAALAPAFKERARIHHRARLEALHITGSAREALIDAALDQTRGHLRSVRKDEIYPAVLRKLTQEALAELEGSLGEKGKARLVCDPRDQAILQDILNELGLSLSVSYTLKCWGGLIAMSEDNQVTVINTLETRLERAKPYLRRYLAALFENVQCTTMAMPAFMQ